MDARTIHLRVKAIVRMYSKWISFGLLGFVTIISGAALYASSSLPTTPSADKPVAGTFAARFASIAKTCGANQFLKGFDANHNIVCAPYNSSSQSEGASKYSVASAWFPSVPSGQWNNGRLWTFLENISGACLGGKVLKWFALDGTKYCVSPSSPGSYTPKTVSAPSGIAAPATNPTGKYQTFAQNMTAMSSACSDTESAAYGVDANGNTLCRKVPVDGVWGGYSTSSCSASCGPGTQTTTHYCSSPARNGWSGCTYDDSYSSSCNTQACPPPTPPPVSGVTTGDFCNGTNTIQWYCGGTPSPLTGWVDIGSGCYHKDTGSSCVKAAAGSTYDWVTGNYGACSQGAQTRTVQCRNTSTNTAVADSNCAGTKPSTTQAAYCPGPVSCVADEHTYYGQWSTYDDLRHGPDAACSSISGGRYSVSKGYTKGSITLNGSTCSPSTLTAYHNGGIDTVYTLHIAANYWYGAPAYSCTGNNQWGYVGAAEYLSSITCTTPAGCSCSPINGYYFTGTGDAFCQARGQRCVSTSHFGQGDSNGCGYSYDNSPGGSAYCTCP